MTSSPARHLRRTGAAALGAAVVAVSVAMGAAALVVVLVPLQLSPVLTASMSGTYEPGDLLVSRPVAPTAVRSGDVIVFTPPGSSERYAHRVVTTERSDGGVVVTTRGDANAVDDPWRAQLGDAPVPRAVLGVPALGHVLVGASDGGGRALLLAVAGLALAVTGTRALLGPPVRQPATASATDTATAARPLTPARLPAPPRPSPWRISS